MKERRENIELLAKREFDIIVIGAGLSGAALAQNAATRGLSVLIIDKNDFAAGASGKGSQIVNSCVAPTAERLMSPPAHLLQEREILRKIAPHLVKEHAFVIPQIKQKGLFNLKNSGGFRLNNLFSILGATNLQSGELNLKELSNFVPSLDCSAFSGALRFHDLILDEARLVLSLLKSAEENNAVCLNYFQASEMQLLKDKPGELRCRDRLNAEEFLLRGKVILNAAGVWSNELEQSTSENSPEPPRLIKRSAIVVSSSAFETNCALWLPDAANAQGRMLLVLPWQHAIYIGSWESDFQGDCNSSPYCTKAELEAILATVNNHILGRELQINDVQGSFSSLHFAGEASGLTALSQGKGTIEQVPAKTNLLPAPSCSSDDFLLVAHSFITDLIKLHFPAHIHTNSGSEKKAALERNLSMLGGWQNKEDFLASSALIETKGRRLSLPPASIHYLIASYGREAEQIMDLLEREPTLAERIIPDFPPLLAEIPFAVLTEMAVSLQDFMLRRCRLAYLNRNKAQSAASKVATLMGRFASWSDTRIKMEIEALEQELFASGESEMEPVRDLLQS